MPCGLWDLHSLTRDWTHVLARQLKCRVLTAGLPGNPFFSFSFLQQINKFYLSNKAVIQFWFILSGLCQKHFSVYRWVFLSLAESFPKPNVCELSLLWLGKLLEMLSEWLLVSWNCWIELWFIQKELDCGSKVHSVNFVELLLHIRFTIKPWRCRSEHYNKVPIFRNLTAY